MNNPVFYLILRKITTLVVRFSVVYEVIKDVAYASGSILLNRLNCPISKEMYRHSFYGRGKRYSSKSLNEKIRDDLQFRQEILNKLDGLSSIIDPITVTINKWKDRDLAYSIGQINFIITGRRIGDIWSLTIKASDLYDFTEWRVLSGGFTLGDFANDFGHILSDFGMINKYRYYVDFQLTLTI